MRTRICLFLSIAVQAELPSGGGRGGKQISATFLGQCFFLFFGRNPIKFRPEKCNFPPIRRIFHGQMAQIRQIFMINFSRENPKSPDFYDKFHVKNREAVIFIFCGESSPFCY